MNNRSFGRPTKAIINLKKYKENISAIREFTKRRVMAVVKSNAYGHGLVPVASYVEDIVDFYAVALMEEAEILRKSGVKKPILVLGYVNPLDVELAVTEEIRVPIYSLIQWRNWKEQLKKQKSLVSDLIVHIKLNTGMNRLGFKSKEEFIQVLDEIKETEGVRIEGIFTHFATADIPGDPLIEIQEGRFKQLIDGVNTSGLIMHIANSAYALCRDNSILFDMVRIGISGYGMLPDHNIEPFVQTQPILELKTAIVDIQELEAGEAVGYGASYKAGREERIGIVPIGYGDGLLRSYAKNGYVLVNGKKRKFAGDRICMDQAMIILEEGDKLGDEVVIYGKQEQENITLEMAGSWVETINYELSCALSERVKREYIY